MKIYLIFDTEGYYCSIADKMLVSDSVTYFYIRYDLKFRTEGIFFTINGMRWKFADRRLISTLV